MLRDPTTNVVEQFSEIVEEALQAPFSLAFSLLFVLLLFFSVKNKSAVTFSVADRLSGERELRSEEGRKERAKEIL